MNDFIPHLIELRSRLISCLWVFSLSFLVLFYFDEKLYTLLADPLFQVLPEKNSLIATDITSPFTVPMKLAFITTLVLTAPYCLYQIWSFVAPGLYQAEKKTVLPFLIFSILCFYIGILFSYFILCPLALNFFVHLAPKGVLVMTDIRHYLDFVLTLLFAGAIAFQVPVITLALIRSKIISINLMIHLRPYVIVFCFIAGMLLTPPDVLSQILVAIPMWGLYEMGILFGKFLDKKECQIDKDNKIQVL